MFSVLFYDVALTNSAKAMLKLIYNEMIQQNQPSWVLINLWNLFPIQALLHSTITHTYWDGYIVTLTLTQAQVKLSQTAPGACESHKFKLKLIYSLLTDWNDTRQTRESMTKIIAIWVLDGDFYSLQLNSMYFTYELMHLTIIIIAIIMQYIVSTKGP